MTGRPLEVLVVDDSAVVREGMAMILGKAAGLSLRAAPDPVIARRKIAAARPDVIVLDLEMPREDGLTFLRELMATDPIPVVICSSHSPRGSRAALEALREGAVEVVEKPRLGVREFVHESATLLLDAIHAAAGARLVAPLARMAGAPARPRPSAPDGARSRAIIALAASTGGPQALLQVLGGLPAEVPGIVVVQHMPAGFTAAFARSLDDVCRVEVREAANGDPVVDGRVLIAPGGQHLTVRRDAAGYAVDIAPGPLVSRHRPSADVLFRSVASVAAEGAVGVIMTGMGDDGAQGLGAMRAAGAATLAQDEASCVVFGMPRAAIALGAVDEVLPLGALADGMLRRARLMTPR